MTIIEPWESIRICSYRHDRFSESRVELLGGHYATIGVPCQRLR
jgi:hypothetical protein